MPSNYGLAPASPRKLGKRPLTAYDRGYGNAKFVQATEKIDADLLLRLASYRDDIGSRNELP